MILYQAICRLPVLKKTYKSDLSTFLLKNQNLLLDAQALGNVLSHLKVERKNTVVNLSSRALTVPEETLLQKGLNFCPTPGEPSLSEIHTDLEKFHNNLRWKQYFQDLNAHTFKKTMFLVKARICYIASHARPVAYSLLVKRSDGYWTIFRTTFTRYLEMLRDRTLPTISLPQVTEVY